MESDADADVAGEGGVQQHLGIPMAMVSGCLYAAAANVASYVAHGTEQGHSRTRRQLLIVDLIAFAGYSVGGVIITVAYASGAAVPVLNASMVASNLLVNMFLQSVLGITFYTKDMRMGTVIFALSVYQLAQVSPFPRDDTKVVQMLLRPLSLGWIAAVLGFTLLAAGAVRATISGPMESVPKILAWSVLISGIGTCTDNLASAFKLLHGSLLWVGITGYLAISFIVLALSAKAPGVCEASFYVPLQLCTQLVLNMLTGLIVWGDKDRLAEPQAYLTAFMVCLLSVYVSSANLDLASGYMRLRSSNGGMSHSRFGKSALELLSSWQALSHADRDEQAEEEAKVALRKLLTSGYQWSVFHVESLIQLIVHLHGDRGSFAASATLVHWLERDSCLRKYKPFHADYGKALRDTLAPGELAKLETLRWSSSDSSSSEKEEDDCSDSSGSPRGGLVTKP